MSSLLRVGLLLLWKLQRPKKCIKRTIDIPARKFSLVCATIMLYHLSIWGNSIFSIMYLFFFFFSVETVLKGCNIGKQYSICEMEKLCKHIFMVGFTPLCKRSTLERSILDQEAS